MARPLKQGLDYFPLDVDIEQDDKIAIVEADHGHVGFSVVIRLLAKIYKEGYFYEWSERQQKLFAKRVNVDINTLSEITNTCINEGLFNQELYEKYNVLTSKGIQTRYLEAVKRRKQVIFLERYFLIDDVPEIVGSNKIQVLIESEDEKRINVNINPVNDDISTQRKEKKSKVKNLTTTLESEDNKKIMDYWDQSGFGFTNHNGKMRLLEWIDDGGFSEPVPVILKAMEEATLADKRNLRYVEGVLKNWIKAECKTLSDVEAHQLNFNQGKGAKAPSKNALDEWANE